MAQTEAGKALQEDMLGRGGLMSVMMGGDVGECIRGAMGAPVKPTGARAQAAKVAAQIQAKVRHVRELAAVVAPKEASYQPHALAELFPAMSPSDYAELLDDVRAHGVREPIWIYEGKVLDGNHRLRAATEACKQFPLVETRQYTGHDPLGFVISMNLRRRHLTVGQRASIADKMAQMGSKNGANLHPTSISKAAAAMHVSPRAVKTVRAVAAASPALAAEVSNGTRTINSADQELKAARSIPTGNAAQTERNTQVGQELSAMTVRVQEWIERFSVQYLRRYTAEIKKLQDKLNIISKE